MLNIYMSSANGQLKEIEDIQNGCWINMVAPTEEEVHFVSERLQIPIDFLKMHWMMRKDPGLKKRTTMC